MLASQPFYTEVSASSSVSMLLISNLRTLARKAGICWKSNTGVSELLLFVFASPLNGWVVPYGIDLRPRHCLQNAWPCSLITGGSQVAKTDMLEVRDVAILSSALKQSDLSPISFFNQMSAQSSEGRKFSSAVQCAGGVVRNERTCEEDLFNNSLLQNDTWVMPCLFIIWCKLTS